MRAYDFSAVDPHSLGMASVGETVSFLGKNGHAIELQDALEQFAPGAILTVESCSIGGWVSYYRFVGEAGMYNTVMFEPLAQGMAPVGRGREGGPGSSELPSPVLEEDAPKGGSS